MLIFLSSRKIRSPIITLDKYSYMKRFALLLAALTSCLSQSGNAEDRDFQQAYGSKFGPRFEADRNAPPRVGLEKIHRWNLIAINASGLDHTPVAPGEIRTFGEQLGPGRSSRAMAIVHLAIFDVINAVVGDHHCFGGEHHAPRQISTDAAIAQGAHDTLIALYPSQTASFDARLAEDLAAITNPREKANGIALGKRVAAAILAARANDGSATPEPQVNTEWPTSNMPGHWRQDPVSLIPLALGAHWGACRPFVLRSTTQFRCPAPPAMTSAAYTTAFNEAKRLGGDGVHYAD